MAKTIQTGIKTNDKEFRQFSNWLGGLDVTHQNLEAFNPYIRGVSRLFLHKPPIFMQNAYKDQTERFKQYLEAGFTAINGISDITVEFTDFEGGFAGQRFSTPSLSRDETESITISLYELSGSPVREYIDTWVTGTRDPRSSIAHYHGGVDGTIGTTTKYGEINHTAEMVYTAHDPTGREMEYVCMFAHCFPSKVPKDHLNYEKGSHEGAQLDLEFRVTKYESPAINAIGTWYVQNSAINWNYLDFDPGVMGGSGNGYKSGYTYDYGSGAKDNRHDM